MAEAPERRHDDPSDSWDEEPEGIDREDRTPEGDGGAAPAVPETVGTGSYVAVSCVAGMGVLLLILIAGLLISRWIG